MLKAMHSQGEGSGCLWLGRAPSHGDSRYSFLAAAPMPPFLVAEDVNNDGVVSVDEWRKARTPAPMCGSQAKEGWCSRILALILA